MLPALAQQEAGALVQGGPVGLVREEGQQVGSERGHLGAGVPFALGRKEACDGPVGQRATEQGRCCSEEDPELPPGRQHSRLRTRPAHGCRGNVC